MSYCTIPQAKAIVGVDVTQELLDEAQADIHLYTPYRWTSTTISDLTLSGNSVEIIDNKIVHLNSPIIEVDSLVIDGTTLTEGEDEDFQVDSEMGIIHVWSGIPNIVNTVVLSYKYGFTSSHRRYADTIPVVRGAEARIALYLKRNPGLLPSLAASGASIRFSSIASNDTVLRYLLGIPKPMEFVAV